MGDPARQSFERSGGQQVVSVSPWVYGRLAGIRDLMAEEKQRRVTYTEVLEVLLTAWDTQAGDG